MRLPESIVGPSSSDVVSAEVFSRNRFLPPRWGDIALYSHVEEVTSWIQSVQHREIEPNKSDFVMARKSAQGARPLTYMSLRDRLLYRVATDQALRDVFVADRGGDAYDEFLNDPLSVHDTRFILKTDIAAFYQYIDHERLVDEVVAQTGDDLAASLAVGVLQGATNRRFGLPQMTTPSDRLSDVYIQPIERALIREGMNVFRFADDFRVACSDYDDALTALELIERVSLSLGLVVNEGKTTTPRRDIYEASLTSVKAAEADLFGSLQTDIVEFDVEDGYGDSEIEEFDPTAWTLVHEGTGEADDEVDNDDGASIDSTPDEVQTMAALQGVLEWQLAQDSRESTQGSRESIGAGWTASTRSVILRKSLKVLALAKNPTALRSITAILVKEPHFAPQTVRYMLALTPRYADQVAQVMDQICSRRITSVWQSLWLAYCGGEVAHSTSGGPSDHVKWLYAHMNSSHGFLAAEATLALARRGLITPGQVVEILDRIPVVHRPTVLMALATVGSESAIRSIADSRIERLQVEWAAQQWAY